MHAVLDFFKVLRWGQKRVDTGDFAVHRLEIDNSRDDLLFLVAFVLLTQSVRFVLQLVGWTISHCCCSAAFVMPMGCE